MRVLVVDDEPTLRASLARSLRLEGYEVDTAGDGLVGLERFGHSRPDVLVLDVMMPVLDGLTMCRRLRDQDIATPVLMLTARDAVRDRVLGLDAGADDYLVKPFAHEELLARIRALLRRHDARDGGAIQLGDLILDPAGWRTRRGEREITLTRTEFALLEMLARNANQILTRRQLYEGVWGYELDESSNSLDVYVGYLRRKLEAGGEPRMLHTVRGLGYALRASDPATS